MTTINEHEPPIREFQDRGIRWMLELPENMCGLLQLLAREIAECLDFQRAEQLNRSLLSETLQKRETDLLYRVPFMDTDQEKVKNMVLTGAQALMLDGEKKGKKIGVKKGEKKGEKKGYRELLLTLLADKFGELPIGVVTAIKAMSIIQLEKLAQQILTAQTLAELHLQ